MIPKMKLRPKKPARENAARLLPKLVRQFVQDLDDALARPLDPRRAHDLRILAKRLRYSLEYFRPCYGETMDSYLAKIRDVQQVLGALNDCRSSRKLLERLLSAGNELNGMQKLFGALDHRETELLKEFRQVWRGGLRGAGERQKLLRYLGHPTAPRSARKPRQALQPVEVAEPEAVA